MTTDYGWREYIYQVSNFSLIQKEIQPLSSAKSQKGLQKSWQNGQRRLETFFDKDESVKEKSMKKPVEKINAIGNVTKPWLECEFSTKLGANIYNPCLHASMNKRNGVKN